MTISNPLSAEKTQWQHELTDVITDYPQLCAMLDLPVDALATSAAAAFPLRVPRSFIARMRPGDAQDPLLRQVLPHAQEMATMPGYTADPLQEHNTGPCPGLLHKYPGRVLLILTGSCAIHCRYCFRRHFPYSSQVSTAHWAQALAYIKNDTSIREVILSGGDPLIAKDGQLAKLAEQLAAIPHLTTLRIHSRLPVVIPSRINADLLAWLTVKNRLQRVLVLHCNHANEINVELGEKLRLLTGVTVLNQSVLLHGINDSVESLASLSRRLFTYGVLPYYLHLPDKVAGSAHFDVNTNTAIALHQALMQCLPGYLVPRLVREVPGQTSKQWLHAASPDEAGMTTL